MNDAEEEEAISAVQVRKTNEQYEAERAAVRRYCDENINAATQIGMSRIETHPATAQV